MIDTDDLQDVVNGVYVLMIVPAIIYLVYSLFNVF
jgi:hypothetical protein